MAREMWMTPAPLWLDETFGLHNQSDVRLRPWLAMFKGDNFLPEFLDLMQGKLEGQLPDSLVKRVPDPSASNQPLKLYQPILGRYYLIIASLVCRLIGFPDHSVALQEGEETYFVLRRYAEADATEQIWQTRRKVWQPSPGVDSLDKNEEKLPLFKIKIEAAITKSSIEADAFGLSSPSSRSIYFGYVPVTNREKYLEAENGAHPNATYILRLVYTRPNCPPLVSLPSLPFQLAAAFDPSLPLLTHGQFEGAPPLPDWLAKLKGAA